MCRRAPLCPAKVAKESPSTASELPVLAIYKTIINMPARLYWAINMGLFDRFKSDKAPTQKADAAAWVKNDHRLCLVQAYARRYSINEIRRANHRTSRRNKADGLSIFGVFLNLSRTLFTFFSRFNITRVCPNTLSEEAARCVSFTLPVVTYSYSFFRIWRP